MRTSPCWACTEATLYGPQSTALAEALASAMATAKIIADEVRRVLLIGRPWCSSSMESLCIDEVGDIVLDGSRRQPQGWSIKEGFFDQRGQRSWRAEASL